MDLPQATRPSLSGYVQQGILLPWMWVDARLNAARNYWITTHAPNFPNSRPVWGIWRSSVLYFSTSSAIAKHMRADPHIQINLESADEVVLIEGIVEPLADQQSATEWAELYNAKYNWDMPASAKDVWLTRPTRVLAWISDSSGLDKGATFSNSATEWKFSRD